MLPSFLKLKFQNSFAAPDAGSPGTHRFQYRGPPYRLQKIIQSGMVHKAMRMPRT